MESALLYDMTIWTGPKYDEVRGRGVLTIEGYFKVALWGTIHQNRNEFLPSVGIPFFKDWVARQFGMYLADSEINVRFQRERPAETEDDEITVDFRVFTFRGDRRLAESYPQETIPLESGGSEYDPDYYGEQEDDFENGDSGWGDDEEA